MCGQGNPQHFLDEADDQLRGYLRRKDELQYDDEDLNRISQQIGVLTDFIPAGVTSAIEQTEVQLRRLSVDLVGLENKKDELDNILRGSNRSAISSNRNKYDDLMKMVGRIEGTISTKRSNIQKLESEATNIRSRMGMGSTSASSRINREVDLYDQLISVFRASVGVLRDQLKIDVETDASQIFLRLTTDKSYQGLRINDQYGLSIVGPNGNEVQLRSAGAEQIVALSLIGALNQNAIRRAPVIMDTPFGRLDPTHRANVLKFLPDLSDQTLLLVHSGEFSRDLDIEVLRGQISGEYKIERLSSNRSALYAL